jgi:site-specific recombinase XerD
MAGDAFASKLDSLRCRTDNPALGVRGPDRGDEVGEQFLYPSESLKFVTCEDVPLEWRRVVALSIYLYPRDAELRALQCRDLDTEHRSMRITKSLARRTGTVQSTKGRRQRTVPLEQTIVPLLETMKAEQGDEEPLVPEMPCDLHMARGLRTWLLKAGVDRHELHHRTPTTRLIRFHDLRASGITWMAVRGDDQLKIQHRAGHTDFATTQRYIRMGEAVREGFGSPFPELPSCVLESPIARAVSKSSKSEQNQWRRRESNPGPRSCDAAAAMLNQLVFREIRMRLDPSGSVRNRHLAQGRGTWTAHEDGALPAAVMLAASREIWGSRPPPSPPAAGREVRLCGRLTRLSRSDNARTAQIARLQRTQPKPPLERFDRHVGM